MMYEYFKGQLMEISSSYIVIEVGGVGYKIFIPQNQFQNLPALGEQITIFVSFIIREFSQSLYGFLKRKERDCFEKLIEVSGVGPKLALAILGYLKVTDLTDAIGSANVQLLSKVPGIGKKTAERLIMELKDKLDPFSEELACTTISQKSHLKDAINALLHLGFQHQIATESVKQALANLPEDVELAQVISTALKMRKS